MIIGRIVPRYRRSTLGHRAFSVGGPTVWNSLPVELREPAANNGVFRRTLKTILFARVYRAQLLRCFAWNCAI